MYNVFVFLSLALAPLALFANHANQSWDQILEKNEELSFYPQIEYPRGSFDLLSPYFESGKVLIFAYGTLANPESASKSLSAQTVAEMKPGIAFGLYRFLNVDGCAGGFQWDLNAHSWVDEYTPSHLAAGKALINAIPTHSLDDQINGVLFEVNEAELQKLIEREVGYDLIPVIVMDWQDQAPNYRGTPRIAYTFSASENPRKGILYTNKDIPPSLRYMNRLRDGFYRTERGEVKPASAGWTAFRTYFENSTYMGDGTKINKRYYINF